MRFSHFLARGVWLGLLAVSPIVARGQEEFSDVSVVSSVVWKPSAPSPELLHWRAGNKVAARLERLGLGLRHQGPATQQFRTKQQLALSLARLGREATALRWAPDAPTRVQVRQLLAARCVVVERETQALAVVAPLAPAQRLSTTLLVAHALLTWHHQPKKAHKLAASVRKLALREVRNGSLAALDVAAILAQTGDKGGARKVFAALDSLWQVPMRPSNEDEENRASFISTYRFMLFERRVKTGFVQEALAMKMSDRQWKQMSAGVLLQHGNVADAFARCVASNPNDTFSNLLGLDSFLTLALKSVSRPMVEKQLSARLRKLWPTLSAQDRIFSAPKYLSFLADTGQVETAFTVQRTTKAELPRDYSEPLLDENWLRSRFVNTPRASAHLDAATRQKWADELLSSAQKYASRERSAEKNLSAQDGVFEAAMVANRRDVARAALEKMQQLQPSLPDRNRSALVAFQIAGKWKRLGNPARARQVLDATIRNTQVTPDVLILAALANGQQDVALRLARTHPPRDPRIVSSLVSSNPTELGWLERLPDDRTRLLALSVWTRTQLPLESVQIGD